MLRSATLLFFALTLLFFVVAPSIEDPLDEARVAVSPRTHTTATSSAATSSEQTALEEKPGSDDVVMIDSSSLPEEEMVVIEVPAPTPTVTEQTETEVAIVETPLYSTPPLPPEMVNTRARSALVNVLCTSNAQQLNPISASGTIIDPRGVILTNAHVAQYLLLESSGRVDIECIIRTGSPAQARWDVELLYLPPLWVDEHAQDLTERRPLGTGEHDWALLRVTEALPGAQLPPVFPFVPLETREAAAITGDTVILASYPAGFVGGITAHRSLYPASTATQLGELFTFTENRVDLISLGGVILAQGGSSGGAALNLWGNVVGIIVTSSDADTTQERDLRAITPAHINRSALQNSGKSIVSFLSGNIQARAQAFQTNTAPDLTQQLLDVISQ